MVLKIHFIDSHKAKRTVDVDDFTVTELIDMLKPENQAEAREWIKMATGITPTSVILGTLQ